MSFYLLNPCDGKVRYCSMTLVVGILVWYFGKYVGAWFEAEAKRSRNLRDTLMECGGGRADRGYVGPKASLALIRHFDPLTKTQAGYNHYYVVSASVQTCPRQRLLPS